MIGDMGSTLFAWLIVIGIIAWALTRILSSVTKSAQDIKYGTRGRCVQCGTKLKPAGVGFGYAPVCARCGREQPWAKSKG